jgi:hypothetical protein
MRRSVRADHVTELTLITEVLYGTEVLIGYLGNLSVNAVRQFKQCREGGAEAVAEATTMADVKLPLLLCKHVISVPITILIGVI